MEYDTVPSSGRKEPLETFARSGPVCAGLALLIVVGSVACGSDEGPVNAGRAWSGTCRRLERTFTEGAVDEIRERVREARAVLAALGDPVPPSLSGAASALAQPEPRSREDVEAALRNVSRWFGVECLGPTVVEGPGDRRLLPRQPPAGRPLCCAMDTAEFRAVAALPGRDGHKPRWALWGDTAAPDAWSGTVAGLLATHGDHVPVHDDAVPATVRGRAALVAPAPLFQGVSSASWGHVVSWRERRGLVAEVALRRGSPADVVQTAEQVRFDGDRPYLPADALGSRTELLFDGAAPSPIGLGGEVWSVAYGTGEQMIRVLGHAPLEGSVHALEFWTVRSEAVTIRGHRAILYAAFDDEGPWGAVWTERDGLIMQVVGLGAPPETIVELASSLVDVSPPEWRANKARVQPCEEETP